MCVRNCFREKKEIDEKEEQKKMGKVGFGC